MHYVKCLLHLPKEAERHASSHYGEPVNIFKLTLIITYIEKIVAEISAMVRNVS